MKIVLETKFDVGDVVYYPTRYEVFETCPSCGQRVGTVKTRYDHDYIKRVRVMMGSDGAHIYYSVSGSFNSVPEEDLLSEKEYNENQALHI